MRRLLLSLREHFSSEAFRRIFALVAVAEALTIAVAWSLLSGNVSSWVNSKSAQAVRISKTAATQIDASEIRNLSAGSTSGSFRAMYSRILKQSNAFFPKSDGDTQLIAVVRGTAYTIAPGDPVFDSLGVPNEWEREAYATRRTTFNPRPYSDDTGTYLAAYTPLFYDGRVVGLLEAEFDSATFADLSSIVRRSFWWSLVPAALVATIISYGLAGMLVEPVEFAGRIVRAANDSAEGGREQDLSSLTPREIEVFRCAEESLSRKQIAERLVVTEETVKAHPRQDWAYEAADFKRLSYSADSSRVRGSIGWLLPRKVGLGATVR